MSGGDRVLAALGAWMHAASWGVISFFTLSRSMGEDFLHEGIQLLLEQQGRVLGLNLHSHQPLLLAQLRYIAVMHGMFWNPETALKWTLRPII